MKAIAVCAALVLSLIIGPSLSLAQTMTVDQVLKKMEAANAATPTLQANIERTEYTKATNKKDDPQTGKIWISQSGSSPRQIKVDFTKPLREIVLISKGKLLHYYPGEKTGDTKTFKKDEQAEGECVFLGLCQPGPSIRQNYDISVVGGPETVDGIKTTLVRLTPKDPKRLGGFASIELWLDMTKWYAVQTRITSTNKNTVTAKFSNFQTAKIPNSEFSVNVPRDAEIQEHK